MKRFVCLFVFHFELCRAGPGDSTEWWISTRLLSFTENRFNLGLSPVDKRNRAIIAEGFYQAVFPDTRGKLSSEYLTLFFGLQGFEGVLRYRWPLSHAFSKFFVSAGGSYSYLKGSGRVNIQYGYKPGSMIYELTQERQMAGVRLQLSYARRPAKSGFEFWVGSATYFSFTRNKYHRYTPPDKNGLTALNVAPIKTGPFKDGLSILPRFNLGVAYRFPLTPVRIFFRDIFHPGNAAGKQQSSHYLKVYPLGFLTNRFSFSYETIINNELSLEFQPRIILPSLFFHNASNLLLPNIKHLNRGFEMNFGISGIHVRDGRKARGSGLVLSFRYQYIDEQRYWSGGISGSSAHVDYMISQTKFLGGIFYKGSRLDPQKRLSVDFYWQIGFYVFQSRTIIFWSHGPYGMRDETSRVGNPSGLYRPNGVGFFPVFKLGIAPRLRVAGSGM